MTVGAKVKQTIATLKGIKGTLEIYAYQCQDQESASVYQEGLQAVSEITGDLEKRLKNLEFEEPQYKGL